MHQDSDPVMIPLAPNMFVNPAFTGTMTLVVHSIHGRVLIGFVGSLVDLVGVDLLLGELPAVNRLPCA